MAAAYVGLVHAEAEGALETAVASLLLHGSRCASAGYAHPVLMNALIYYKSEVASRMGDIGLVPNRSTLQSDSGLLSVSWTASGAEAYWDLLLKKNHGAGAKYLESLLHPVGLELDARNFRQMEGRGIKRLSKAPASALGMAEFVSLRGRAMHVKSVEFRKAVQLLAPEDVQRSGERATAVISALIVHISKALW